MSVCGKDGVRSATRATRLIALLAAVALWSACGGDHVASTASEAASQWSGDPAAFRWALPAGIAPPVVPSDNPMSDAKVELGRRLFYDVRLSVNGAVSCASCHRQEFAFADAKNLSVGATGEVHPRNSIGLSNAAYQRSLGWAAPATTSFEQHAMIPMFGETPIEMGLKGRDAQVVTDLQGVALYRQLFAVAFGGDASPIRTETIVRSLAAFQRTILSFNAPIDRYRRGEASALSAAAGRGMALFDSRGCVQCHAGADFTLATIADRAAEGFANTGLYNIGGAGAYPARNRGLMEITGNPADMGRMKIPSLRNVALTFPYGHDGSVGSLDAVLENYARGGRVVQTGPNAGDGRDNPVKDSRLRAFILSPADKGDLLAFLQALTDSTLIRDVKLSNPWR